MSRTHASRPLRAAVALAALALGILPVACDSPTDTGDIQVRVLNATLEAVGDSVQLSAMVNGTDAAPSWESLDPDIITVTPTGMAHAIAAGTGAVRVRVGRDEAQGTVTVLPPIDIRVSDLERITSPEGAEGMRMRVRNLGGRGYYRLEFWKLDVGGTHRRILGYRSDTEAPAGMDIVHTNYLTGEAADWVIAYAREPRAESHVLTSCTGRDDFLCPDNLPEQPAPVVDLVALTPAAAVMNIGETRQYTARAFSGGREITGRPVEWSTPSPTVISITDEGLVQALASGYGEVHATVDGVTTAVGLTVATPEPEPRAAFVSIRTPKIHMWLTQRWPLQADAFDTYGRPLQGRTVTWSVEDTLVARVDVDGQLLARTPGATRVKATVDDAYAYATVKSFARPDGAARLGFFGMLSDTSTNMVAPTFPVTWVDEHGVGHPAYTTVKSGGMDLDWSTAEPAYSQRLVLATYVVENYQPRLVDETEYLDQGSIAVFTDWFTGNPTFRFTSSVHEGLTYQADFFIPGELVVQQAVGELPARPYYFHLE